VGIESGLQLTVLANTAVKRKKGAVSGAAGVYYARTYLVCATAVLANERVNIGKSRGYGLTLAGGKCKQLI
jgi:hypothetical protein